MNLRPLVIITTRLPPQVCGIGTFSWLLNRHWGSAHSRVEFLVVDGATESAATLGYPDVSQFDAHPAALSAALDKAGAADIFLHYAGRAYHRYGFPRWLPPVLAKWKKNFPKGRLLIFFHEMPGNFPLASRHFWIDRFNRQIISQLARLADVIVTNTSEHADQLAHLSDWNDVHVVPVSSNIEPPAAATWRPARSEFALVGLPFGRWQTLRFFKRELRSWQESGHLSRLHLIGPNDDKFSARCRDVIRSLPEPNAVVEHGKLPANEVSDILLRSQFGLSNANESTWSKSTIFMTYAAHGCPAVVGEKSDTEPLRFAIGPAEVGTISDSDLAARAGALKNWYQNNATWPAISAVISQLLPLDEIKKAAPRNRLTILTPEAAGAGGVGDYTERLVDALPNSVDAGILVWSPAAGKPLPAGGKLLIQYSAYGFDRHGYPRQLIRKLLDWKRQGGTLAIMFHEIWTFWPRVNKNAFVQFFHRRGIGRLVRSADAVFTTTDRQAEHLQKFAPAKTIGVIPVGSNIHRREDVDLVRRRDWAVLFGLAGSRVRALKQMRRELRALGNAGLLTRIITVGGGDRKHADEERTLLAGISLKEGFEQLGRRHEDEISRLLLSVGYGISSQDELSLCKSGTFMAYAAHGLNVLDLCANPAKSEPISLLVAPAELLGGISETELKRRAGRLREWQARVSSWESIASAFAGVLQLHQ